MKRVAIVGSGGSGKSTLARRLGRALGLPVVHLDVHYWRPGWKATAETEWAARQAELVTGPEWIADGNFGETLAVRLAPADTIVFLDLPRRLCIERALRRFWRDRGRPRPDLPPGCPESLDLDFLRWLWRWPAQSRPRVLAKLEEYRTGRLVRVLRTPWQVERFARAIEMASLNESSAAFGADRPPPPSGRGSIEGAEWSIPSSGDVRWTVQPCPPPSSPRSS